MARERSPKLPGGLLKGKPSEPEPVRPGESRHGRLPGRKQPRYTKPNREAAAVQQAPQQTLTWSTSSAMFQTLRPFPASRVISLAPPRPPKTRGREAPEVKRNLFCTSFGAELYPEAACAGSVKGRGVAMPPPARGRGRGSCCSPRRGASLAERVLPERNGSEAGGWQGPSGTRTTRPKSQGRGDGGR